MSLDSLSILYLGTLDGTSLDRAQALRRLGHVVEHVDLRAFMPQTPWMYRLTWKIGGHIFAPWILRKMPKVLQGKHFQICLVDSGEWVTPSVIRMLRGYADRIINYAIDDPFGDRDVARFRAYRYSLADYDLCVVVRSENVEEAKRGGARRVLRVYRSSDDVSHAPRPLTEADREKWAAEVMFLGTWFPERGPFMVGLIERGVPLTLRGSNWNKAAEWSKLRPFWKGDALAGDDYAKAIQVARVNLGLLSKGNRDLHTTRSLEIPSLGGLFCAERTVEHTALYEEGVEALFWADVDECAAVCKQVLADEPRRQAIAEAGHRRSFVNGFSNEKVLNSILEYSLQP